MGKETGKKPKQKFADMYASTQRWKCENEYNRGLSPMTSTEENANACAMPGICDMTNRHEPPPASKKREGRVWAICTDCTMVSWKACVEAHERRSPEARTGGRHESLRTSPCTPPSAAAAAAAASNVCFARSALLSIPGRNNRFVSPLPLYRVPLLGRSGRSMRPPISTRARSSRA